MAEGRHLLLGAICVSLVNLHLPGVDLPLLDFDFLRDIGAFPLILNGTLPRASVAT